jgi:hypothetical protein
LTLTERANVDLRVNLAGRTLAGPVVAASGTFGFGPEYAGIVTQLQDVSKACDRRVSQSFHRSQ